MNYYIIKANDKIDRVIEHYNLSFEELKAINQHIVNWDKLIPGTKIKLPRISDAVCDEIDCIEPFIEEFYPKIDVNKYQDNDSGINNFESFKPIKQPQVKEENTSHSKTKKNVYQPYYYPYPGYYYVRKKRKKSQ